MFLSIHHVFMLKCMELITYQCFGEWICLVFFCVNIADFYHIISHIFSYKMETQYHSFSIQWYTRIIFIYDHAHVFDKYRWWIYELHYHITKVVSQHDCFLQCLFSAVNYPCMHWYMSLWWPGCWCWTQNGNNPCDRPSVNSSCLCS